MPIKSLTKWEDFIACLRKRPYRYSPCCEKAGRIKTGKPRKNKLNPKRTTTINEWRFNAPIHGHTTWDSIYSPRQLLALVTLVGRSVKMVCSNYDGEIGKAVQTLLAFAIDKQADLGNSLKCLGTYCRMSQTSFWSPSYSYDLGFAEGVPLAVN